LAKQEAVRARVDVLSEENVEISVRTVERVLAEEGFPKLPRRTGLKVGITVKGAAVPERSEAVTIESLDGKRFESDCAGVFLFAPFLAQFDKIPQLCWGTSKV
jgi:hypothetical protein